MNKREALLGLRNYLEEALSAIRAEDMAVKLYEKLASMQPEPMLDEDEELMSPLEEIGFQTLGGLLLEEVKAYDPPRFAEIVASLEESVHTLDIGVYIGWLMVSYPPVDDIGELAEARYRSARAEAKRTAALRVN